MLIALFNRLLDYLMHISEGHEYGLPVWRNGYSVQQCKICKKLRKCSHTNTTPICYGSNPSPQSQAENGCHDCPWVHSCVYIRKT